MKLLWFPIIELNFCFKSPFYSAAEKLILPIQGKCGHLRTFSDISPSPGRVLFVHVEMMRHLGMGGNRSPNHWSWLFSGTALSGINRPFFFFFSSPCWDSSQYIRHNAIFLFSARIQHIHSWEWTTSNDSFLSLNLSLLIAQGRSAALWHHSAVTSVYPCILSLLISLLPFHCCTRDIRENTDHSVSK